MARKKKTQSRFECSIKMREDGVRLISLLYKADNESRVEALSVAYRPQVEGEPKVQEQENALYVMTPEFPDQPLMSILYTPYGNAVGYRSSLVKMLNGELILGSVVDTQSFDEDGVIRFDKYMQAPNMAGTQAFCQSVCAGVLNTCRRVIAESRYSWSITRMGLISPETMAPFKVVEGYWDVGLPNMSFFAPTAPEVPVEGAYSYWAPQTQTEIKYVTKVIEKMQPLVANARPLSTPAVQMHPAALFSAQIANGAHPENVAVVSRSPKRDDVTPKTIADETEEPATPRRRRVSPLMRKTALAALAVATMAAGASATAMPAGGGITATAQVGGLATHSLAGGVSTHSLMGASPWAPAAMNYLTGPTTPVSAVGGQPTLFIPATGGSEISTAIQPPGLPKRLPTESMDMLARLGQVTILPPKVGPTLEGGLNPPMMSLLPMFKLAKPLDEAAMLKMQDTLPKGALFAYPALPPWELSQGAINVPVAPSLQRSLMDRAYPSGVPMAMPSSAEQGETGGIGGLGGPGGPIRPFAAAAAPVIVPNDVAFALSQKATFTPTPPALSQEVAARTMLPPEAGGVPSSALDQLSAVGGTAFGGPDMTAISLPKPMNLFGQSFQIAPMLTNDPGLGAVAPFHQPAPMISTRGPSAVTDLAREVMPISSDTPLPPPAPFLGMGSSISSRGPGGVSPLLSSLALPVMETLFGGGSSRVPTAGMPMLGDAPMMPTVPPGFREGYGTDQISLIGSPLRPSQALSREYGVTGQTNLPRMGGGLSSLDSFGLRNIMGAWPTPVSMAYPALPTTDIGPSAVNLPISRDLADEIMLQHAGWNVPDAPSYLRPGIGLPSVLAPFRDQMIFPSSPTSTHPLSTQRSFQQPYSPFFVQPPNLTPLGEAFSIGEPGNLGSIAQSIFPGRSIGSGYERPIGSLLSRGPSGISAPPQAGLSMPMDQFIPRLAPKPPEKFSPFSYWVPPGLLPPYYKYTQPMWAMPNKATFTPGVAGGTPSGSPSGLRIQTAQSGGGGVESPSGPAAHTEGSSRTTQASGPGEQGLAPQQVDELARQVYGVLRRRISREKERLGGGFVSHSDD